VAAVTNLIAEVVAGAADPYEASLLNVQAALDELQAQPALRQLEEAGALQLAGAIYHTHCGVVDLL